MFLVIFIFLILQYRGWLERESRYGLQPGHNWFLIAVSWWQQWKEYVKYVSIAVVHVGTVMLHCFDVPFVHELIKQERKEMIT